MKMSPNETVLSMRRWFHFAYLLPGRQDRELLPHQTRDAEAALFLQSALCGRGFRFAGPIFNYPAAHRPAGGCVDMDYSFLRPNDLLVLTTRPPLDDVADGVRNRVHRSHTELEELLFACVRRHLPHCSRSKVTVADRHVRAFPEVAAMANVQFRQTRGAAIDARLIPESGRWWRAGADSRATVGYLIFEEHAWENGPGLLASFGMCGTDTLVWNHLLATAHCGRIASAPFAMAEITAPMPPLRPQTVGFAKGWKVRFLTPEPQPAQ